MGMFTGIGSTQSDRFIILSVHDHDTSECWLIDAEKPLDAPRLVAARETGIEYDMEHHGERFIIKTNRDGAEDRRLLTAPVSDPRPPTGLIWCRTARHFPRQFLSVFKDWLVRLERENALPRIVVRDTSGEEHTIAFAEEAYSLGLGDMRAAETDTLRFSHSSPTTPAQVFDYNMRSRERILRKTQEVPSGHTPSDYVARRVLAPAHDGEQVPLTLLYHKDTPPDGTAPVQWYRFLCASLPAGFSTNILSLVNRGFIYAMAHIRGGRCAVLRASKAAKRRLSSSAISFLCGHLVRMGFTRRGGIIAHRRQRRRPADGAGGQYMPDLRVSPMSSSMPITMLDDTPLTPPEWPMKVT
ncbi:MAG: hypothetical protein U1E15_09315 [Hyphomicrobiales bacterium]